jgi:hypothetical protein
MSRATTSYEYRPASMSRYSAHSQARITPFFNTVQHVPEAVVGFDAPSPANTIASPLRETPMIISPQTETSIETEEDDGKTITIFIPYVSIDEAYKNRVVTELTILNNFKWRKEGLNVELITHQITQDLSWTTDIPDPLTSYTLTLLLVSPEFIATDFCGSAQLEQAVKMSKGETVKRIIPILLRPCRWELTPLRQIPVLPSDRISVAEANSQDKAFENISCGLEIVVDGLNKR